MLPGARSGFVKALTGVPVIAVAGLILWWVVGGPEWWELLSERLCSAGEAFVYAAMTRLMVKRLARA